MEGPSTAVLGENDHEPLESVLNLRISLSHALISLLLTFSVAAAELQFDGQVLDRANAWDSYPSHLFIGNQHHLWHCSTSSDGSDAIFHSTTSSLSSGSWSTPTLVLDRDDVVWADQHTCDPTVLLGDFSYGGQSYTYAMYFTADDGSIGVGVNNVVGVAFSNDGVSWTVHGTPIITPQNGLNGTYGVGGSSAAWGPDPGVIQKVYRDTTVDGNFYGRHRLQTSMDGVDFGPDPALVTQLTEAGHGGFSGTEADIAYNPIDGHWYAAISSLGFDPDFFAVRILRSSLPGDLGGSWEVVGDITESLVGSERPNNPGLARNENSTLYVDPMGWAYVFFGTGPQNVFLWELAQVRFRVFETAIEVVEDSFTGVGQNRGVGDALNGTQAEYGARLWTGDTALQFSDGYVTASQSGGDQVAMFPYGPQAQNGTVCLEADIDTSGSGWVGIGFGDTPNGVFLGDLWALMLDGPKRLQLWADGLNHSIANIPIPDLSAGYNRLQLFYDQQSNTAHAMVNGVRYPDSTNTWDLDTFGFTPSLQYTGFHFSQPSAQNTRIDHFALNRKVRIFSSDFETGDCGGWSACEGLQ